MSAEEIFAQRMRLGRLFDIYGGLLTAKQKQCLGLYFYAAGNRFAGNSG